MSPTRYRLLLYALFLTPLAYSHDGDSFRAFELVGVGLLVSLLAIESPLRPRWYAEYSILAAYCAIVIVQQLFIPNGDLLFGAKYALTMCAAFVPAIIIATVEWDLDWFCVLWDRAMKILAVVITTNFIGSYVFGFGEVAIGVQGKRAFGYLGDSFTPIIVFAALYFFFRRKFVTSAVLVLALIASGGKAATGVLAFAMLVQFIRKSNNFVRLAVVVGLVLGGVYYGGKLVNMAESESALSYSLNTRLVSFDIAWSNFRDHAMFGVGINQSMKDVLSKGSEIAQLTGISQVFENGQIDNALLRTMAETGLLGTAALLALIAVLIRRAWAALTRFDPDPGTIEHALIMAGGLWTISFVLVYQMVGWFEAGHPLLSWLLLISASTTAVYRACGRNAESYSVETAGALDPEFRTDT